MIGSTFFSGSNNSKRATFEIFSQNIWETLSFMRMFGLAYARNGGGEKIALRAASIFKHIG